MKKMVVVYYVCEVCGREFDDSNKCRKCEEGHINPDKIAHWGDKCILDDVVVAKSECASNLQISPDVFNATLMRQIEKMKKGE